MVSPTPYVSYRGPLVVLLGALLLTAGLTGFLWTSEVERDRLRFANLTQRTQASIESRMQVYVALLRATAGLFEAEGEIHETEFRRFIRATDLERFYPGILGVGFTRRLAPDEVPRLEQRLRPTRPGFRVWPEGPRPEYHSILFLEPMNRRNAAAIGYDMSTEPTRKQAMDRARDSGLPAATGRVTLVQEIDVRKQAGFLIYLPLYREGFSLRTLQDRRKALWGFVYAPFRAGDLLEGIIDDSDHSTVGYRLYSGTRKEPSQQLYGTRRWREDAPLYRTTSSFEVGGYPWTLEFVSMPEFERDSPLRNVPYVALLGIVLSAGLFWVATSQARARWVAEQARRRAEEARQIAEAAERSVALMAEASDALAASLEVESALQAMADRMVPDLADWCAVDLLDEGGVLRRVAMAHRDPARIALGREFHEKYGANSPSTYRVVRTGRPELAPEVTDEMLEHAIPEPERRAAAARLGLRSYLCVPMVARGQVLGALTLGGDTLRRLDDRDLLFAEEVAERAARAVDNVRLYRAALEATAQARDALQSKSQFLAVMSHEIRTPLNGILGMTDLLQHTPLSEEQQEYAATIHSSSQVLLTLLNDILDFSRLEAGKLRLEMLDFDLRNTVEEVVELFRARADARGVRLEASIEDVPSRVRGDPSRLFQILMNLVSNAVKFTSHGGVDVRVSRVGEGPAGLLLRFEVEDTGVGIPAEGRQRLFEPFYQADPSSTRRFEGSGLGLAIVQQLVGLMQGEVGLESEEGKGSTFWFTAWFGHSELEAPATSAPAAPSLPEGLRVLVAEDNPVNRRVIVLQLERMGVEAEAVPDGEQALKALEERDYDVVLMDCQMPVLDGFAATRELRRREQGKRHVPVVALTANVMEGSAQACLSAGMDDFVAKPVDLERLSAVLRRWSQG